MGWDGEGGAQVMCAPGFENVGATWVVCGRDGLWKTAAWTSDLPPICQGHLLLPLLTAPSLSKFQPPAPRP